MTTASPAERTTTQFLWMDLTRKCQLNCTHCYNASGPEGDHGTMTREDWLMLLEQAAEAGIEHVTFIGGEPTMHPHAIEIADRALALKMSVEVYSNLVHVTDKWWALLQREGMSLATSYYSNEASKHNEVTRRPSHPRTRANIIKAIELGVPIRAGIVGDDEQIIAAAKADLEAIGVKQIGVDRIREFGRARGGQEPDTTNLCGGCGEGRASIGPTGTVSPCVFSTWMGVGNVHADSLSSILDGPTLAEALEILRADWGKKDKDDDQNKPCGPDCVPKNPCDPRCEPYDACRPGTPTTCQPRV
ncbi:radical SAM/SPASM domain-containing protein [Streptomyces luteireticuli]|uniref:Radical SAM core domain-containing protein n=1 Tax=Streptomyces luteireticuli TaxID=173858 RepID=A0ABN0Z5C6_9ACTN